MSTKHENVISIILELENRAGAQPTVGQLRERRAWLELLDNKQLEQLDSARVRLGLEETHRVQST